MINIKRALYIGHSRGKLCTTFFDKKYGKLLGLKQHIWPCIADHFALVGAIDR